jgi:Zn-finger nucleic acid-binding protein
MDRWSFGQLVKFRRSRTKEIPIPPPPLDTNEYQRKLNCPRCGKPMEIHPYYGPGNIVIETCASCNLIWLDYGELSRVVNAPGRDRGTVDPNKPMKTDEDIREDQDFDDGLFQVRII